MPYTTLSDSIEKPLLDDRSYKFISLSNGLKALLIHDPTTDKASAALDVFVGSYKDKAYDVSGLAHFCEHLLFMGTAKYPQENEYSSYLSKHGGHSNAYTAFEHTNYYFEVNANYLQGGLDRFAQFFIDPLFDESCKDREIKAVDSENKKNLQNDQWRFYQLDKLTSNPNHPYNHFSTGNYTTLNDIPVENGVNVRQVLLDFYNANYSANLMNLVILGKEDLNTLTQWAEQMFSPVVNKLLPGPEYCNQIVYTPEQMLTSTKAKSIMDLHRLELTFMIPNDEENDWKYLPGSYYSHLLGHESKGSIYYHLNQQGLINSLSAGNLTVCKGSTIFIIECDLTPKGLKNHHQIIESIFQYLKLVINDEPKLWLFNEIKQMLNINFKFGQKQNAASTTSKLSNGLHKFSSYIPGDYILNHKTKITFNADEIKKFGSFLNPNNFRYQLTSNDFDDKDLPCVEKWYGTKFNYESIDPQLISQLNLVLINPNFHFPHENSFIPENFDVFGAKLDTPLKHPYLIKDDSKFQIWFKQDDQFNIPKMSLNLFLHLPNSNKDITSLVMTQLYCDLFDDELNDVNYYASLVGLSFSINQWRDGILIKLIGYNDKISNLLKEILTQLTKFKPSAHKFDVIKTKFLQDFKNFGYEVPYYQANTNFLTLINEKVHLTKDKIPVLQSIEFDDINNFIEKDLWSGGVFIESLIIGNINMDHLYKITQLIDERFNAIPIIDKSIDKVNQLTRLRSHINDETVTVNLPLADKQNVNSCIEYFVQIDNVSNYHNRALAELLTAIFHEPCFNQLRTQEQLGYVVFSSLKFGRSYCGYRILIQSEISSNYLRTRIESFLNSMNEHLELMDSETFEKFKRSLIEKKQIKLKNLNEENNKLWSYITDGYYDFRIDDKLIDIIEGLDKQKLMKFYNDFIKPGAPSPKVIFNLNSDRTKERMITKFFDGRFDINVNDEVEKYGDDTGALVQDIAGKLNKDVKELKKQLDQELEQMFPKPIGKEIEFNEFKKMFPLHEAPKPVQALSNFYYNEAHL